MPYQISYHIDKRIIYHRFYGTVTIDDIRRGNEDAIQLIRQGLPPVHDIVDASDVTKLQFTLRELLESTSFFKEQNLGWMILVGGNPLVRFFASVLGQVGAMRFRIADDNQEALRTLRKVDLSMQNIRATQEILPHTS